MKKKLAVIFVALGFGGMVAYANPPGPPAGVPILNSTIYQRGSALNVDTATVRSVNISTFSNTPSLPNGIKIAGNIYNSFGVSNSSGNFQVLWNNGYLQQYPLFINVKDPLYGAKGDALTDDTAAIQKALNAVQSGGTVFFPATVSGYKVTSQISIGVNRITLLGEGNETQINYTPAAINTRMFYVDSVYDRITFKNFYLHQTNGISMTGTSAILVASSANRIEVNNVTFTGFSRADINLGTPTFYLDVYRCSFLKTQDTTSTFLATAILSDGSNVMRVENCLFSENDRDVSVAGGTTVIFQKNSHEIAGDSGNTLIANTMDFSSIKALDISDNYFEGNFNPTNNSVIDIGNCIAPHISGNSFAGQDGAVNKSDYFITVTGASDFTPIVENNYFIDPTEGFVLNTSSVVLRNNKYSFGGVVMSTYSGIMTYITHPEMADIGVPAYATYDPVNLSSAASFVTTGTTVTVTGGNANAAISSTFTVTGARMGDSIEYFPPYDLQGIVATAYASSTDSIRFSLINPSTSTAINLTSGSWGMRIKKPWSK